MLFTNYVEIEKDNFNHEVIADKKWLVLVYAGSEDVERTITVPEFIKLFAEEVEDEVWISTKSKDFIEHLSLIFYEDESPGNLKEPFMMAIELGKKGIFDRAVFFKQVRICHDDSSFKVVRSFVECFDELRLWICSQDNNREVKSYLRSTGNNIIVEFIKSVFKFML